MGAAAKKKRERETPHANSADGHISPTEADQQDADNQRITQKCSFAHKTLAMSLA